MRPPGEKLRQAVERVNREREARPDERLTTIIDEIALQLDLSPIEVEWLVQATLRVAAEERPGSNGRRDVS